MARYRDCDGDVWELKDGRIICVAPGPKGSATAGGEWGLGLAELARDFGPLVALENAPKAGDAPVTSAELAAFCAELREAFEPTGWITDVSDVLRTWARRMGGEA